MSDTLVPEFDAIHPQRFALKIPTWMNWLPAISEGDLTETQVEAMVGRSTKSTYYRVLARDPDALRERTKTDLDIFHNTDGGLSRGEREFAATVVSRLNGCHFCVAVHATSASTLTKRRADVQRLLDEGVTVRIDERWDAIADAAVALTRTPSAFGPRDVERLRNAGLDEAEVLDVVMSSAFFNWANRLMLALGEPSET